MFEPGGWFDGFGDTLKSWGERDAVGLAVILSFYLVLTVPALPRDFQLEEVLAVNAATQISAGQYPLVYFGEGLNGLTHLMFWKPPLFLFSLALSFKAFGVSETSAHLVPLVYNLGTVILTYIIARDFVKSRLTALAPPLLLVANPLFIQCSLLVADGSDGSTAAFFVTLFLYTCYVYLQEPRSVHPLVLRGLVVTAASLMFLSKIEPAALSVTAVLAYTTFTRMKLTKRKRLTLYLDIGAGFVCFLLLWCSYNMLSNHFDGFLMPFQFLLNFFSLRFSGGLAPGTLWLRSEGMALSILYWISPFFFLIIAAGLRLTNSHRRSDGESYLWLWILSFALPYIFVGWAGYMPRYVTPALPALCVIGGLVLERASMKRDIVTVTTASVIALTVLLPYYRMGLFQQIYYARATWLVGFAEAFLLVGIALLILNNIVSRFISRNRRVQPILLLSLFLIYLTVASATNYLDLRTGVDVSTLFGNKGYKEAGLYIKERTTQQDLIVTSQNIAYYAQRRYFDIILLTSTSEMRHDTSELVKTGGIKFLAAPEGFYRDLRTVDPDYMRQLQKSTVDNRTIGTIRLLEFGEQLSSGASAFISSPTGANMKSNRHEPGSGSTMRVPVSWTLAEAQNSAFSRNDVFGQDTAGEGYRTLREYNLRVIRNLVSVSHFRWGSFVA